MMEPQYFSYDAIATAIVILLGFFGALITVDKVMDIVKKWKKPKKDEGRALAAQQAKCAKMFSADNERMGKMEERLEALQREMETRKEGERVLIAGVRELLEHELHNGNGKAMKDASDDLFNYLNRK